MLTLVTGQFVAVGHLYGCSGLALTSSRSGQLRVYILLVEKDVVRLNKMSCGPLSRSFCGKKHPKIQIYFSQSEKFHPYVLVW